MALSLFIRVDPAPGFAKLDQDATLLDHRITLDVGRVKNFNKNPVVEKAVRELEDELLRLNNDTDKESHQHPAPLKLPASTLEFVTTSNRQESYGLSAISSLTNKSLWTTTNSSKNSITAGSQIINIPTKEHLVKRTSSKSVL